MKKYRNYIIISILILTFCVSICFVPINASRFIPLVEEQVANDYGIKIHIGKLIFRFGPSLKVKAPVMHVMYPDNQKFAQFNNIKIFIPWSSLFSNNVKIKRIYADDLIIKLSSDDKYLTDIIKNLNSKDFKDNPEISLSKYSITYKDTVTSDVIKTDGENLVLSKLSSYKNYKFNANGIFYINDKKYITYDCSLLPNIDIPEINPKEFDYKYYIDQIKALDFHSDIMTDLKISKNINGDMQYSGLINIDNVSVLDVDKKAPKSFMYLTFWGDKVGISSNVYASGDKKVIIDGIINTSKKPDVDIKVKTDEINLADLYKKIRLFTDLSSLKMIDSVNGKLTADFTLKGSLKKIRSNGYLKISEGQLKASGLNIDRITANIDFSNNAISIADGLGYVSNAPIMLKGKIDDKINLELLMSNVNLKNLLPKNTGIDSGIVSLDAKIGGTAENITHKENVQISNFKAHKNNHHLSFTNLTFNTNKESIAYINNVIIKPEQTEVIKLPQVKLHVAPDSIKIVDTNIFMPNSRLKLKSEITDYSTKDLTFNVFLDGYVNSRDIKILKDTAAVYPLKLKLYGNKQQQNAESQVQLEKALFLDEPVLINLSAKLEDKNLKVEDLSISSFNGTFSDNLKANIKGQKKIVVSGIIENIFEPVYKNFRIFIPQQFNLSFKDTLAQIKGDLFLNGKYNQPDIVGQLNIQNLINQSLQLAISNATIDFNKNIAIVNAPIIKLADSAFSVISTVSTDFSKEITIKSANIKSKYTNFDTILMYKDSSVLNNMTYHLNEGKFYAEKAAVSLYGSPLHLSSLITDFNILDNTINCKNLASEMYNGKLGGSFEYNLKDDSFKTKMQARGISSSPIFDVITPKKDSVSGVMDFDINIRGNIINKQSLNGDVRFIVHNGRMGTLGKLEHLLYAQNVVADNMLRTSLSVVTKAITLKDTGLFKYLRGDISLQNGIANIKMLQSQGPLMALYIKGQYNPVNDYAKLIVLGRLSDEVITGLGAFADFSFNKLMIMLTGDENKYNIKNEDLDKLPQLPMRNTKEFRSIIIGPLEKASSVIQFNWISYSQKSLRQKDVPTSNVKIPDFVESLPY